MKYWLVVYKKKIIKIQQKNALKLKLYDLFKCKIDQFALIKKRPQIYHIFFSYTLTDRRYNDNLKPKVTVRNLLLFLAEPNRVINTKVIDSI